MRSGERESEREEPSTELGCMTHLHERSTAGRVAQFYNPRLRGICQLALMILLPSSAQLVSDKNDQRLPAGTKADHVIVYKHDRTLSLYYHDTLLKTYRVALGGDATGAKMKEGDHKTPEGYYVLDRRNPQSKYHRSIHISYPDAVDRARARQLGVPPGGDIFLHGLPNGLGFVGSSHRLRDWTDGCIAVTNREMDEIWEAVPDGTPIEIKASESSNLGAVSGTQCHSRR